MSTSPQISYTVSFSIVLSSAVIMKNSGDSDLSVDGQERKCTNILFSYRR